MEGLNVCDFDQLCYKIVVLTESLDNTSMKEIKGLDERLAGLQQLLQFVQSLTQSQADMAQGFQQNQARAQNIGDPSVLPDLCVSHQKQLMMLMKNHSQLRCVPVAFLLPTVMSWRITFYNPEKENNKKDLQCGFHLNGDSFQVFFCRITLKVRTVKYSVNSTIGKSCSVTFLSLATLNNLSRSLDRQNQVTQTINLKDHLVSPKLILLRATLLWKNVLCQIMVMVMGLNLNCKEDEWFGSSRQMVD